MGEITVAKSMNFEEFLAALAEERRLESEAFEKREEARRVADEKWKAALVEERREERRLERQAFEKQEEARRKQEEAKKEADEKWKEERRKASEEYERRMDKMYKELSNNIGGVNNRLGDLTEAMFSAELWKKFEGFGYGFTKQCRDQRIDIDGRTVVQLDNVLENGTYICPVEVKTKMRIEDVDRFLVRINKVREYMDKKNDLRKIIAAFATAVLDESAVNYAMEKGFYVFLQSGDSIMLANTPPGFKAREW